MFATILNYLQRLIVKGILDHIITKKSQVHVIIEDQLLLYIKSEGGVGKSRVVQALELGFIFLGRQVKLVISTPTGYAVDGIGGSTIHTALEIHIRVGKSFVIKINTLWSQRFSLIIDKVSMIDLKLLTSIDKQL